MELLPMKLQFNPEIVLSVRDLDIKVGNTILD